MDVSDTEILWILDNSTYTLDDAIVIPYFSHCIYHPVTMTYLLLLAYGHQGKVGLNKCLTPGVIVPTWFWSKFAFMAISTMFTYVYMYHIFLPQTCKNIAKWLIKETKHGNNPLIINLHIFLHLNLKSSV